MKFQLPKGTHDVFGKQARQLEMIGDLLKYVGVLYGYQPISTPIFEHTELFNRSVGSSSDIVRKEMYTFLDKGKRSLTLRPEMTAGVMRAIINNKLDTPDQLPLKLYYQGPAFRYERPQLGRFRQFSTFGIEQIGIEHPLQVVETIALGYHALSILGLKDVVIKISSLGCEKTRTAYRQALIDYYKPHLNELCQDCQNRYQINPLRLLDCKVAKDKKIANKAPKIKDYYTEDQQREFASVVDLLKQQHLPIIIDDLLVRGLDYYSDVIFEYHIKGKEENGLLALGGGGQYGNLIAELGGENHSGVGFGLGIERLYNAIIEQNDDEEVENLIDVYVMVINKDALEYGYFIAQTMRYNGYRALINYTEKSFKSLFKTAQRVGATYAAIIGEDELKNNKVTIKDLQTQTQTTIESDSLIEHLDKQEHDKECQEGECNCHHHKKNEE
jgi:histidyl-tRNA synthetase